MGKTIYSKCQEILKNYSGKEIGLMKLRQLVIMNIGGQERTITQALKVMGQTKLIQDIGNAHFKIL